MSLKIIFMGTPDFSVPILSAIKAEGHNIVAVYTRAPAIAGRGMTQKLSPVHKRAEELGIPILTPKSLKSPEEQAVFQAFRADVAVVAAYGLLLPKPILEAPKFGCLNVHASLLPRWRGAAPIQRALMAGDTQSGVAIMQMDEGLDTGAVALLQSIALDGHMTAGDLHDQMSDIGAQLIIKALNNLEQGQFTVTPQDDKNIVYAHKITNADARIDWSCEAETIHNQVRGLSPFPGAFFETDFGKGRERVRVLKTLLRPEVSGVPGTLLDEGCVACGKGAVRFLEVQRAGKAPMEADAFFRGARLPVGSQFT